jgi:hypothetical protein
LFFVEVSIIIIINYFVFYQFGRNVVVYFREVKQVLVLHDEFPRKKPQKQVEHFKVLFHVDLLLRGNDPERVANKVVIKILFIFQDFCLEFFFEEILLDFGDDEFANVVDHFKRKFFAVFVLNVDVNVVLLENDCRENVYFRDFELAFCEHERFSAGVRVPEDFVFFVERFLNLAESVLVNYRPEVRVVLEHVENILQVVDLKEFVRVRRIGRNAEQIRPQTVLERNTRVKFQNIVVCRKNSQLRLLHELKIIKINALVKRFAVFRESQLDRRFFVLDQKIEKQRISRVNFQVRQKKIDELGVFVLKNAGQVGDLLQLCCRRSQIQVAVLEKTRQVLEREIFNLNVHFWQILLQIRLAAVKIAERKLIVEKRFFNLHKLVSNDDAVVVICLFQKQQVL